LQVALEGAFEDLGELFEVGAGGGGVDGGAREVPEEGDDLAAAEAAGLHVFFELLGDGFFCFLLLGLGDKAAGVLLGDRGFFDQRVGFLHDTGDFVGVDSQGEEEAVVEDVVVEGELVVEDVAAGVPAVFGFLDAEFAGLEGVLGEFFEGLLGDLRGVLADDSETAEGDGTGIKAHLGTLSEDKLRIADCGLRIAD